MSEPNLGPPTRGRDAKYQAAASWAADVHGSLRASRRIAWIVAAAAGLVAVLEALALAGLAPLKTVVPYTIEVDRQTGYVQMVKGLKPGPLSETSAVTQSFLVQYVIARETFDAADLRDNYRKVTLWSAGEARNSYENDMRKTNPASPLNLYSPTTIVSTTIDSVSLLSPTTALVRFETVRRDAGGGVTPQGAFVAVMAFRYTGAPMRMEDRFLNPLGFQVISYRRDTESVGIAPPSLIQSGPSPNVVTLAPPVRTPARPAYVSPGAAELGPNTPALSRPPFIGPMPK
jgi:type IV secretion system protein VirB8